LEEQHDEVSAKLNSCNEEIKGLMLLAKTEGEEAYRTKGKAHQEAKELNQQLATLSSQLGEDASVRFTSLEELEDQRQQVEQEETSI
ncbi:hypothetical protein R0K20_21135, partial [Staphylococcus sp. SIMBA_130]